MTDSGDLTGGGCAPCEGGGKTLTGDEVAALLPEVSGWELGETEGHNLLVRDFAFKDFREALGFVNRVGELAEMEGHHPDIHLTGYNRVRLVTWTHSLGGLHRNDFILAAKVNRLF